jgi:HSP20 family protein
MPAMNVKDHNDDFEIEFSAPGFSKKDFDVTINDDMLIVYAHKKYHQEPKEDAYSRKEFNYSSFKRSIKLPQSINLDQDVKATYRNGILKLNFQKKDMSKDQHKILIKVL